MPKAIACPIVVGDIVKLNSGQRRLWRIAKDETLEVRAIISGMVVLNGFFAGYNIWPIHKLEKVEN